MTARWTARSITYRSAANTGPSLARAAALPPKPDGCSCSFGVEGALEDNHVPGGLVRNFWRPVADHLEGRECSVRRGRECDSVRTRAILSGGRRDRFR